MDGIIIINKPKGCTSHDVVRQAKKTFNKKVGHSGTLDPNATGVLPLLIGKGTEVSKYLINHDKIYEAVLQLGEKRDTGDIEGKVIEKQEVANNCLDAENVGQVLKEFLGQQTQIPPMYSAIKVNGKKLYEYARKGENIEGLIEPRSIIIYDIDLIKIDEKEKTIEFRVHCSKGTYIRTLCEDIAKKLGTVGYMKELNRTSVGDFKIDDSIELKDLENCDIIQEKFISIEDFFNKKEIINIDSYKLKLFLNGVQLTYNLENGIYKIYSNNKFIGIGIVKDKLLKRDIVVEE